MARSMGASFLTAEWRYVAMLNYEVDPAVLVPFVPNGTELDSWRGKTFASMVGFLFLDTRLLGLGVPFHRNFEEINLRFYVRRTVDHERRRGVVFVKEIVPRVAIAWTARFLYNENYVALPTHHAVRPTAETTAAIESVKYAWIFRGKENWLEVVTRGEATPCVEGSEEEFITQHYWGYSSQGNGGTMEYRVEHPPWRIWQSRSCGFECDVENLYGKKFVECLGKNPSSAFLAEGSAVTVYQGLKIA